MSTEEVTIRLHRRDWDRLDTEVQVWIGRLVGPLFPDAHGMLAFTIAESHWRSIEKMQSEQTH